MGGGGGHTIHAAPSVGVTAAGNMNAAAELDAAQRVVETRHMRRLPLVASVSEPAETTLHSWAHLDLPSLPPPLHLLLLSVVKHSSRCPSVCSLRSLHTRCQISMQVSEPLADRRTAYLTGY